MARTGKHVAGIANLRKEDVVSRHAPLPFERAFHGLVIGRARRGTDGHSPQFSASSFLPDVRRYGVTFIAYTGKVLQYVMATPEGENDAENPARLAVGNEASVADIEALPADSIVRSGTATARPRD